MRRIELTQGQVALVDDEDFDYLNQWKWTAIFDSNKKWYALRADYSTGKRKTVKMHRLIMKAPDNMQVDHVDLYNTLDNRKHNLRLATKSQNMRNRGKQSNNRSGYKGVSWSRQNKKWYAWIGINGKTHSIGHFDDIEEAAYIYDQFALQLHGEFARTNFL